MARHNDQQQLAETIGITYQAAGALDRLGRADIQQQAHKLYNEAGRLLLMARSCLSPGAFADLLEAARVPAAKADRIMLEVCDPGTHELHSLRSAPPANGCAQ